MLIRRARKWSSNSDAALVPTRSGGRCGWPGLWLRRLAGAPLDKLSEPTTYFEKGTHKLFHAHILPHQLIALLTSPYPLPEFKLLRLRTPRTTAWTSSNVCVVLKWSNIVLLKVCPYIGLFQHLFRGVKSNVEIVSNFMNRTCVGHVSNLLKVSCDNFILRIECIISMSDV
jgi:hypothetical protein